MAYILYTLFGLLPSIIWLFFYLKKDAHPESNKMIIKIFFYGMAAAVIAAAIEIGIEASAGFFASVSKIEIDSFSFLTFIMYHLLVIAFIEEATKFFIIRQKVINDKEFDEPTDAMLYMIIIALGFAALENLLYLSPLLFPSWFPEAIRLSLTQAALVTGFRFIGATFLHALASGLVGFFLAYSICFPKRKYLLLIAGIAIASVLHGLFNISIIGLGMGVEDKSPTLIFISISSLIIILSSLAIFVSFGFKHLKKIASVCKIK